jgi:hypothetical protein
VDGHFAVCEVNWEVVVHHQPDADLPVPGRAGLSSVAALTRGIADRNGVAPRGVRLGSSLQPWLPKLFRARRAKDADGQDRQNMQTTKAAFFATRYVLA